MTRENIREKYQNESALFMRLEEKEEKQLIVLSILRLLSFVGGFILIWFGFTVSFFVGIILILVTVSLFFYLLKFYSSHSDKKEIFNNLSRINRNEADALEGNLSSFDGGNSYTDIGHDFSNDVDLFGILSLFQYINRTVTTYGRDILAAWLSDPYPLSHELISHQEAIKELANKEKWRHEFMATGMKKPLEKSHIINLLDWMAEPPQIKSSPVKKFLIWILPAAALISLFLTVLGILHYSVFSFIFLANLFYVALGLKKTNEIHNKLSKKYQYLSSFDGMIKIFGNESFISPTLNDIKLNITSGTISASASVNKLSRLIQSFDNRMNFVVGFALNGLLLWDYHSIYKLEKWKSAYKELFPVWLEMLGKVDAYISLGNYAFNNPDFVYPSISDKEILFSAKDLGHPLIVEKKRVCNDFLLMQPYRVCIISGANMAGKSTFLRTIAVNLILGMTGAPVCASGMSFRPLKLFTSMRTTDSLSNNESYFYAELRRLKSLKSRIENGEPVLFILDEILKGTNSADKSLGSKLFLKRMVELGGRGLIATHDTSVGEMEKDHPGIIINKCFEIEIDGDIIKFDYKIQDGITHKMNAALLMKQMGILD
jgi:ABC-type multidrug transport system fused ATPase/permease subunit